MYVDTKQVLDEAELHWKTIIWVARTNNKLISTRKLALSFNTDGNFYEYTGSKGYLHVGNPSVIGTMSITTTSTNTTPCTKGAESC